MYPHLQRPGKNGLQQDRDPGRSVQLRPSSPTTLARVGGVHRAQAQPLTMTLPIRHLRRRVPNTLVHRVRKLHTPCPALAGCHDTTRHGPQGNPPVMRLDTHTPPLTRTWGGAAAAPSVRIPFPPQPGPPFVPAPCFAFFPRPTIQTRPRLENPFSFAQAAPSAYPMRTTSSTVDRHSVALDPNSNAANLAHTHWVYGMCVRLRVKQGGGSG